MDKVCVCVCVTFLFGQSKQNELKDINSAFLSILGATAFRTVIYLSRAFLSITSRTL